MSDIFISYSRKDSAQALGLADRLRSNGMEVWIDPQGIEVATSGSTEVEQAIKECKAFCLLLSRASLESNNVVKETSLASEFKRAIVLIELYAVTLTDNFHSQFAGLQRVAFTDLDAILLALKKLGIGLAPPASSSVPSPERTGTVGPPQLQDSRKSLIVIPFEDLSPPGEDNAWFADGLTGELIDALGHIKSLRILDRNTSLSLRGVKLRTVEIGKEFNTRYFIEGSVRKFGDQLKISASLLDIETGDYLWQESLRGEFKDIFDIQESVAAKVVDGLKLTLTKEEKTLVQDRGTENTEAYELFVRAREYFRRGNKKGFELAIQLLTEAIKLDPNYANAYQFKARALAMFHRDYDRDPSLLDEGMQLVEEALRLKPDLWEAYNPLSALYLLQGNTEAAEEAAKTYVQNAPDDPRAYFALGFFYSNTDQPAKAIAPYEQAVKLQPEDFTPLFNLVVSCDVISDVEKRTSWAEFAIPRYERHLKLHPDDETMLVRYPLILHWADKDEEAREVAKGLSNIRDGVSLFNAAHLQCVLQDYETGLKTFRKAIEAGFRDIRYLNNFLNDEEDAGKLKGTPEYEEVKQMVEKLSEP
jgi:adenylate cyclase